MSSAFQIAMQDMGMLIESANANQKYLPGPVLNVLGFGAKGDGKTDDSEAFSKALSLGGRIEVPNGTYLVGNIDISDQYIFGKGTIIKRKNAESAFHLKGKGAFIQGLFFQAEDTTGQPNADIKLGDGSRDIRIDGCTFRSSIYSAISGAVDGQAPYTVPVSGVIISNCIFTKQDKKTLGYSRPLYMHSISNLTINGNIIRDTAFDAIRLRENDGFVLINGNQFINIGDPSWPDAQTRDAIDTYWSGASLTITNNIVRTTAYVGFDIKGYAPDGSHGSKKIIIANNQIYGTRYNGISIAGDDNYDGAGNYKFIDGVIIEGNIIQNCGLQNISVGDAAILLKLLCKNIMVKNNYIVSNFARGIFVQNTVASKANSKNIQITGNICANNGRIGDVNSSGIQTAAISHCKISDNLCYNDSALENPYQSVGIVNVTTDNSYTAEAKTVFIDNNDCYDNLVDQIITNSSNSRADSVASFFNNIQSGPTTSQFRGSWQHQRSIFFGTQAPIASDGAFRVGDEVHNITPTTVRNIGMWKCITAPSTWVAYGTGRGTTAQRPTLTANDANYSYFDTTLAKMIMWDGTAWLV